MGGGRGHALLLLLLFVLALVALEYLFGSILEASPLRTYLYTPLYDNTQPSLRYPITFNVTTVKTLAMDMNISAPNEPTPTPMLKIMDGVKNGSEIMKRSDSALVSLPMCANMSDLGPVVADTSDMVLKKVETKYPEVDWGGRYTPPNCIFKQKVAIIVPFRGRHQHLPIFLNHIHPFLIKQQIEYGIFIVEQKGSKEFNRAKLMNVGFVESQKLEPGGFHCFIFHDVDLLPLDTRNIYSCTRQPRHMAIVIPSLKFKLPYKQIFGGVTALTLEQIQSVNGFSNKYWGWGGEDDDMYYRLRRKNYHIARYAMSIARYVSLKHNKSRRNPKRFQLLRMQIGRKVYGDGLSTLKYEIVQVKKYHLYTHILANINEYSRVVFKKKPK